MENEFLSLELKRSFIDNCYEIQKAMSEGNYKTNNKAVDKLIKIYRIIEKDINLANEVLIPLLNNSNMTVKCWAATHCLVLGLSSRQAQNILAEVAKEKSQLGFSAEMTLDTWRKGKLKIY